MRVPTALPAEPTAQIVWETIDDATVRVTFEEPRSSDEDASDGVPMAMPVERSTTVAVVVHDLQLALNVLVDLARRDRIPIDVLPLWRTQDQTAPVGYDPMALTGAERVPTDLEAISLNVLDWRKFKNWINAAVIESETKLFQLFDVRKASAVVFRLRTLANEVKRRHPPNDLNHMALRLG